MGKGRVGILKHTYTKNGKEQLANSHCTKAANWKACEAPVTSLTKTLLENNTKNAQGEICLTDEIGSVDNDPADNGVLV
ncbi:hypothetical protein JRQ81_007614 [Phrynocephalus forsythii]|uniref:Uncharacterized protein n=1 Tax=Phrynocephalus forsythii TaxID=171643 RepID=A0A9Q0XC41_9SAUR|nr:hypothetical protein JRQ81_007614 [Phrynocephalus forsythii]